MGVGGVKASIAAFQAVDPGSIPGQRTLFSPASLFVVLCMPITFFWLFKVLYINIVNKNLENSSIR